MIRSGLLPGLMEGYDALKAIGSLIDVWRENKYPRQIIEKRFFQQAVKHESLWFLGLCFEHKSLVKSKFRNSCYSIKILRRLWRPKSSFTQIQGVLEAGVNRGIYVKAA